MTGAQGHGWASLGPPSRMPPPAAISQGRRPSVEQGGRPTEEGSSRGSDECGVQKEVLRQKGDRL